MKRRTSPRARRPTAEPAAAQGCRRTLISRLATAGTSPRAGLTLLYLAFCSIRCGVGESRRRAFVGRVTPYPSHDSCPEPSEASRSLACGSGSGSQAIGKAWATWVMP